VGGLAVRETTLLLHLGPAAAETTAEFLRIAVGLLAGGHRLTLWSAAPLGALPAEAEDHRDALLEEGLSFTPSPAAALRRLLEEARGVVRLGAAGRGAAPRLLVVDDAWLRGQSDADLLQALRAAGQVIRG
jgi:hypothetical protein